VKFEWDEQKWGRNIRKHSIDFRDAVAIFADNIVTMEDTRFDYGEQRYISLGLLKGRVIVVVHTEDEDVIRLISARKATKYEQRIYYERITD
jgi:uncharacterized DUF497 family protein